MAGVGDRGLGRTALRRFARSAARTAGFAIASDGSEVETAPVLTPEALERLFTNRTCGLKVPGFADPETCAALATWMLETFDFHKWEEASTGAVDLTDMFYGIGLPVNAIVQSPERCRAYFEEAPRTIRRVREAARGRLGPVDRLRLELDELWPEGANVRVHPEHGKKMLVGLGRLMRPDGLVGDATRNAGIVHTDASVDLDDEVGLFSANVYLRTPDQGGELEAWSVAPSRFEAAILNADLDHAFDPPRREATQASLRRRLPAPHVIDVRPGDLVVINAGRPHAVRGFTEGVRITLQTFLEFTRGQPLQLFA